MTVELSKHQRDVAAMFDAVAPRYDRTNDLMSWGQDHRWRQATARAVGARAGEVVLDLAAGTGTSTRSLVRSGAKVVACDLSWGMVEVGRRRDQELAAVVGDALALPFADEAFDAVTVSFGLRNMPDVDRALRELRRVTRPGGRLVVLEFSVPAHPALRTAHRCYLRSVLPVVDRFVDPSRAAYRYLGESILQWVDPAGLTARIVDAGWDGVACRTLSCGAVAVHRASRPA